MFMRLLASAHVAAEHWSPVVECDSQSVQLADRRRSPCSATWSRPPPSVSFRRPGVGGINRPRSARGYAHRIRSKIRLVDLGADRRFNFIHHLFHALTL